MIELEEAVSLLVNSIKIETKTEKLDILSAYGRICAEDVTAPFSVPHFPKSGMDGMQSEVRIQKVLQGKHQSNFKWLVKYVQGIIFSSRQNPVQRFG